MAGTVRVIAGNFCSDQNCRLVDSELFPNLYDSVVDTHGHVVGPLPAYNWLYPWSQLTNDLRTQY